MLIMRYIDVLDILALNHFTFACYNVSQVPDRYCIVAAEVAVHLMCQEIVDLSFSFVLGDEVLGSYFDLLISQGVDLGRITHVQVL